MLRLAFVSPIMLLLGAILGGTCSPGTDVPATIPATPEQEPNNTLAAPQVLDLSGSIITSSGNTIRITGTINADDDIDLYSLGNLKSGDRVVISVDGSATDAQLSLALFEVQSDQNLATLTQATNAGVGTGLAGAVIDAIIRRDGSFDLGIKRRFGSIEPGQNYDVTIDLQHGATVPGPASQIVMFKFGGGTFLAPDGNTVSIGPFDPAAVSPSLGAVASQVFDFVTATARTNFAGYGVQILRDDKDAPPTDKPYSTVFFGPVLSGEASLASDGLGVAVRGIDSANLNRSDVAVVFAQLLTPSFFSLSSLTAEQLGTAAGNVASHETGHLLGLQHTFDASDIMNTLDSPATLLTEQRFKRSTVHFFVFDPLETLLTQDAPGELLDVVGNTRRQFDLQLTTGDVPFALASADIDLDGGIDLAVANQSSSSVSVFANLGNRSFSEAIPLDVGAKPIDILAFETQFIGEPSIITVDASAQKLSVFYLTSNGFAGPTSVTAGTLPRAVVSGDFNGDFNIDLAVANYDSNDVSILLSNGFGGFNKVNTVAVGKNPQGVAAADFDGDGRLDLAVTNFNDNTVTVLKGAGNGGFSVVATLPAGNLPLGIVAVDLNKDGRRDIAVTSGLSAFALVQYSSSVCVLINQGNNQFAPQAVYSVEPGAEQIAVGDLNGDGFPDLATSNSGDPSVLSDFGTVSLLINRGDGTFGQDIVLEAGYKPSDIVIADLDGLGVPDIAVANRGEGTVSVFFNQ